MIRTIRWQDDAVVMIDQKALPRAEIYLTCTRPEEVLQAIRDLTIRGAPAIGVAAAMGIALGMQTSPAASPVDLKIAFSNLCDAFAGTRPTARNLFWAIERMRAGFEVLVQSLPSLPATEDREDSLARIVREGLVALAIRIGEEDIAINRRMGRHGRVLLEDGDTVLTHCNAGALATAGYGTALGVIRAAVAEGKRIHVFVDETRPVLQGARLTAWELMREDIPATLITDNMAGFLMRQGKIRKVIVGADRIARNGDTANKIGTYTVAVLARENSIPFYVAAPLSTIDISLRGGSEIPIEERSPEEVTTLGGVRIAPEGIHVCNPAFDVTPARYITAIITEAGVAGPPYEDSIPALAETAR